MNAFPSKFLSDNRKSKIKNLKLVGLLAIVVALTMCGAVAQAQQQAKVPRIGFLGAASASALAPRIDALRQGLRELGYIEGKNIAIEHRYAEGKLDKLPDLAVELVRLKVDVLVSGSGNAGTRALKQATSSIPIVMTFGSDPVAAGWSPASRDPEASSRG